MSSEAPVRATLDEDACGMKELCIRSLLRRSFGLFWDHAWLFVSAHLIILLIFSVGNYLLTVSGNVLLGPFILGACKISLRVVRNQNTDITDLLSGFEYFLPAFLANILVHIMAVVAGLFLFVPGLLVFLTYSTTYFFILEEDAAFWDAMEKSRALVWGNFKRWLVLGLVILAVNLAGLLFFGVGLLVTIPYSHLLITLAYEEELIARKKWDESVRLAQPAPGAA